MKSTYASLLLAAIAASTALAGEATASKKTVVPPEEDRWKFQLAIPGFMAGVEGTIGINGSNSNVKLGFDKILPKIDMAWATRLEASKGRFGVLAELFYLSMSDGVGSTGVIKKLDVRVDEYLADLTLRYRVLEGPKGYVDVLAGVRYTNLYQALSLRPNDEAIGDVAEKFTDDLSARLRERIENTLSEGRFRNALEKEVSKRVTAKLGTVTGPDPSEPSLPNAPLANRTPGRLGGVVERIVQRREAALVAEATADVQAAAAAEKAAINSAVATERAKLRAKATALRARVDQRITKAQAQITHDVSQALKKGLHQDVSRTDDWWDPYVGVRARYNFTPAIYAIGRGDIGGFGVGSDLMWQAEAAVGFQLTRNIYAELGYRALSFDYEQDGLTYDTLTHGVQLTLGVLF